MEKAAQSLGRLQEIDGAPLAPRDIDLRGANLQGFDLQGLSFAKALFQERAHGGGKPLRGTFGGGKAPRCASGGGRTLQAHLDGAHLGGARLSGRGIPHRDAYGRGQTSTSASGGGIPRRGDLDEKTILTEALRRGAAVRDVDETTIAQLRPFWDVIFADGSVPVAPDDPDRPAHWPTEELNWDFLKKWHAWQATLPRFRPPWRRD